MLMLSWNALLQYSVDALSAGSFYALVALGIALVFGIMRVINFAYSEMIMISAIGFYAMSSLPLPIAVVGTIVIAVGLGILIERAGFRLLRDADHATLLIASFAIAYLLNNLGTIVIGDRNMAVSLGSTLTGSVRIGEINVARIDIVTIAITAMLLGGLTWLLRRTSVGVQMRAAAEDFRTAQVVGVRANRVIVYGFALSGVLAGVIAILLVGRTGTVDSGMGLTPVLFALVATIVGGMTSLSGAVVGGYLIGIAFVVIQVVLPEQLRPYRDVFLFSLVLLFFLVRPEGILRGPVGSVRADGLESAVFTRKSRPGQIRNHGDWSTGLILGLVLVAVALIGSSGSAAVEGVTAVGLVMVVVVVGLYIFVGNSGVFSFGHLAFMGIGAYVTAILTIPSAQKELLYSEMPSLLRSAHASPWIAVLVGAGVAGLAGLILALPLMRLNGLAAALGTLAILLIVHTIAVNYVALTNGSAGMAGVASKFATKELGALAVIAVLVALGYQHTMSALRLRATREDPISTEASGISVVRARTPAFVLSAAVVGLGGGMFTLTVGSVHPDAFYVWDTFLIMSMLVVGGMASLSGAVVGVIAVSAVGELLRRFEDGVGMFGYIVSAPAGLREVGLSLLMLGILLFRSGGIMGGSEFGIPRRSHRTGPSNGDLVPRATADRLQPDGLAVPTSKE